MIPDPLKNATTTCVPDASTKRPGGPASRPGAASPHAARSESQTRRTPARPLPRLRRARPAQAASSSRRSNKPPRHDTHPRHRRTAHQPRQICQQQSSPSRPTPPAPNSAPDTPLRIPRMGRSLPHPAQYDRRYQRHRQGRRLRSPRRPQPSSHPRRHRPIHLRRAALPRDQRVRGPSGPSASALVPLGDGVPRRHRKRRRTSPSISDWAPTVDARSGAPPP